MAGRNGRPGWARELLLIAVLYAGYRVGRLAANGNVEAAFRNATDLTRLERLLRLPSEAAVQDLFLHSTPLIKAANVYYATVHFPAMVLFLLWMFWRHPVHYVWIRRVVTLLTGSALAVHLLMPLAPPRMLGMLDTGKVFGPSVYGPPDPHSLANQFAAMPSLHVGWAIVIAVGLVAVGTSPARWLWVLHPVLTALVVVVTANHYWLDGAVAAVLLAGSLALAPRPGEAWTLPLRAARPRLALGRQR